MDLTQFEIINLARLLCIKSHYLFRQAKQIRTLLVSRHDVNLYNYEYKKESSYLKYVTILVTKRDPSNKVYEGAFLKYNSILYSILNKKDNITINNDKYSDDTYIYQTIYISRERETDQNEIFYKMFQTDITSHSINIPFSVYSEEDINNYKEAKGRKIENKKETKNCLHYKLVESDIFENPTLIFGHINILGGGLQNEVRKII